jgi:hypothetical protein
MTSNRDFIDSLLSVLTPASRGLFEPLVQHAEMTRANEEWLEDPEGYAEYKGAEGG